MTPRQSTIDVPPDVRAALTPLVEWIVTLAIETAIKHAKGNEGPRYYDAKNAPMGPTAFLRLAGQGAFPSFKVGRKVRAKADDVHAYMERQQGAKPRAPRMPNVAPPVDVNSLTPAELHELSMNGALPARKGQRAPVDVNELSPAEILALPLTRSLPPRKRKHAPEDVNELSPAEILALPLTRSLPPRKRKHAPEDVNELSPAEAHELRMASALPRRRKK